MKKKGTSAGIPRNGDRPSPIGNGMPNNQVRNYLSSQPASFFFSLPFGSLLLPMRPAFCLLQFANAAFTAFTAFMLC